MRQSGKPLALLDRKRLTNPSASIYCTVEGGDCPPRALRELLWPHPRRLSLSSDPMQLRMPQGI
jgi:hypothetical protein